MEIDYVIVLLGVLIGLLIGLSIGMVIHDKWADQESREIKRSVLEDLAEKVRMMYKSADHFDSVDEMVAANRALYEVIQEVEREGSIEND